MSASEYLRCAPKYTISRLNNQNFSPPPRTLTPSAPSAPRFSRLRRSPPPLKNPGYALAGGRYQLQCSSIALVLARLVYCDSVLFGHATSSRDSSLFRTLMHGLSSDPKARAFYGGLHYQAHWHRFYCHALYEQSLATNPASTADKTLHVLSCILSILLCGSETWTLLQEDLRKLEAFHMRCQRMILA